MQGAQSLPNPPVTETLEEPKPQSVSPAQSASPKWYDMNPTNEPFTPDNAHALMTRQRAERKEDLNFAKRLAAGQKEREHRLSSVWPGYQVPIPITITKTLQTHQQSQNMDTGPKQKGPRTGP